MDAETPTARQPPRRSRWKRWAFISLGLFLLTFVAAWLLIPEPPEVSQAQRVMLGMTKRQVREIMGEESVAYDDAGIGDYGLLYGQSATKIYRLKWRIRAAFNQCLGVDLNLDTAGWDSFPVHIYVDANDRVVRIKRGSEIIEAQAAPKS